MSNTETSSDIKYDFNLLKKEVIDPGYCVTCGGCEAVCPAFVIQIERYLPKLVGECITCGGCCPRHIKDNQYFLVVFRGKVPGGGVSAMGKSYLDFNANFWHSVVTTNTHTNSVGG